MKPGTMGFVGIRLKEAREARGLSGAALSDLIGVTRSAISLYETSGQTPRPEVMAKISSVLRLPLAYFRNTVTHEPRTPFFRSLSAATKAARRRALCRYEWVRDIVDYLGEFIEFPPVTFPDFDPPTDPLTLPPEEIELIAERVRRFWRLGDGPIENVVWLLERHGAIVVRDELRAETLDAFSDYSRDERRPYIVLGADKGVAVRSRFDAAHELGHFVLHRALKANDRTQPARHTEIEQQAHRFAAAFLLPAGPFAAEFYAPSLDALLILKPRWKVSVAMMIKRAEQLQLISPERERLLWTYVSRRRWRLREPLDDQLPVEEPRTLRRASELLIKEGMQRREQILARIPLAADDIEALVGAPGLLTPGESGEEHSPRVVLISTARSRVQRGQRR